MAVAALIIGIDGYERWPLTSAVNDALTFKKTIVDLGLVDESDVTLLTSPEQPESQGPADADTIRTALFDVYRNGDAYDRHFLYYSGHGALAYDNAAQTRTRTILVPANVDDLEAQGNRLIDFSELLDVMELVGPAEQFYFIDACRDMPYNKQPDPGRLGFAGAAVGSPRTQSGLYATCPLARALGAVKGLGIMTGDVVEGLASNLAAIKFVPEVDQYQITMDSLFDYVYARAMTRLESNDFWQQSYEPPTKVPERGPRARPLRILQGVAKVPFTIHIEPDEAAAATQVRFAVNRYQLPTDLCYPARANHETVYLEPQWHHLEAASRAGDVNPTSCEIDMRSIREQKVVVCPPRRPAAVISAEPLPPRVVRRSTPGTTRIVARAEESQTRITLRPLCGTDDELVGRHQQTFDVEPAVYHIAFEFASRVFSSGEIYLGEDETVEVSATASLSPILQEAYGFDRPSTIQVSEHIGEIQAELLPTILPMIGMKPFVPEGDLVNRWTDRMTRLDIAHYEYRPLSVVVAIDGTDWPSTPGDIARRVTVGLEGAGHEFRHLPLTILADAPANVRGADAGAALHRVAYGVGAPRLGAFSIVVSIPDFRDFYLQAASLPRRATVVTATVRSDGSFEFGQNIFRIPGLDYELEPVPFDLKTRQPMQFARALRLSQLAYKLFESGRPQLGPSSVDDDLGDFLRQLLYAKWADPLLGCMGYYAVRRAFELHRLDAGGFERIDPWLMADAARNLLSRFSDLPDAHVVAGIEQWDGGSKVHVLDGLLASYEIPVLTESVYHLARYADAVGHRQHPIRDVARSLVPGAPWTLSFQRLPVAEPALA